MIHPTLPRHAEGPLGGIPECHLEPSHAWNEQAAACDSGSGACGRHPDNMAHKTGMPGEAEAWWVITRVLALVDIVRPLSHISS